jgi:hypothetical protein
MVLAGAVQLDVLHQDEFVVPEIEGGGEDILGSLPKAPEHLGVATRDSIRGALQAVAIGILADRDKQITDGLGDGVGVVFASSGIGAGVHRIDGHRWT